MSVSLSVITNSEKEKGEQREILDYIKANYFRWCAPLFMELSCCIKTVMPVNKLKSWLSLNQMKGKIR